MTTPPRPPRFGPGALIALTTLAGAFGGAVLRQPTLGFIIGLALGVGVAVLLALGGRR